MSELTPPQYSELADDAYTLSRRKSIQEAIDYLNKKYKDVLTFSEENLLKSKTGGPWFIKCKTAFGFTLFGRGSLQGNAFIIFRGTKYLADWLSNLNAGV